MALRRLLHSLSISHYPDTSVPLIISLENGADDRVVRIAEEFQFNAGEVTVIRQSEMLGLRDHILWCGDLTETYGAVILLEDDLYVDPWFYHFALQALHFYQNMDHFGGISLYSPRFHEFADLAFEPLSGEFDTFFMQTGSSSGQLWTQTMWTHFKAYLTHTGEMEIRNNDKLPDWVRYLWPESSWKKYFNAWLADEGRFMVYPYQTFTTNCSDPSGSHLKNRTALHQSPLADPTRPLQPFHFARPDEKAVSYDSFMELTGHAVMRLADLDPDEAEIDLYGIKPESLIRKKKYVITSKEVRKRERGFPLMFRPLEQNLLHPQKDPNETFFSMCRSSDVCFRSRLPSARYFRLAEFFLRFSPYKFRFFIGYSVKYLKTVVRYYTRL